MTTEESADVTYCIVWGFSFCDSKQPGYCLWEKERDADLTAVPSYAQTVLSMEGAEGLHFWIHHQKYEIQPEELG